MCWWSVDPVMTRGHVNQYNLCQQSIGWRPTYRSSNNKRSIKCRWNIGNVSVDFHCLTVDGLYRCAGCQLSIDSQAPCWSSVDWVTADTSTDTSTSVDMSIEAPFKIHKSQKVAFIHCNWRILIHFVSFCFCIFVASRLPPKLWLMALKHTI